MSKELVSALVQLGAERGIDRESVLLAAEEAYGAALNRKHGSADIHVRLDPESGAMRVFRARRVRQRCISCRARAGGTVVRRKPCSSTSTWTPPARNAGTASAR